MLFKINEKDYTKYIIPGTYDINNVPEVKEWEDAAGFRHYVKIRDRIVGSFNMEIHKREDYEAFIKDWKDSKDALTNVSNVYLAVNNDIDDYYDCQINIKTKRNLSGTYKDYFEQFTVEVEQK